MNKNVSVCGGKKRDGCGAEIKWGEMFGKRHPFNFDGTSHFDSCPVAHKFRAGVRTLGDRDSYYRMMWRAQESGYGGRGSVKSDEAFNIEDWEGVELPASVEKSVSEALCKVGGPYQWWVPAELRGRGFFTGAAADARGTIGVVLVSAVFYRELAFRLSWIKEDALFFRCGVYRICVGQADS